MPQLMTSAALQTYPVSSFISLVLAWLLLQSTNFLRLLYREGRKQESYNTGNGLLFLLWQTPSGQQFWESALFVKCLLWDVLVVYAMVNLSGTETDTLPWGKEQRSTLGCLQKQTFRNALQRCLRLKLDKNETQDFWPLLLTRTETWDSVLHRSTFCDRWEKMKILEGRLRKFLFLPKLPCRISGKFLFRTRSLARILHYHQVRSGCHQDQAKHFNILLPVCSRCISTNKTEKHLACHPELHMVVISKQEDAYIIIARRGWEALGQAISVARTIIWFSPWVLSNYCRGRT